MGSQQLYSLSWGEFGSSLTSTVRTLRNHNDMVDVTLAAGGKIFPAHKLVLSAASPLLMELLKSTNCHHPVLMLAGITAPDLEALLQFVYQGEVSVDSTQLPSLLQAAHCLNIQALSPQTLTTEKTMAQVSVPFVITESVRDINLHTITPSRDLNMTPQTQPPQDLTPLMPVRKRKRKQSQSSETESMKWRLSDSAGSSTVETQQLEQVNSNHSEDTKDGIMDDQHSNGETELSTPSEGKLRCASEQPCICNQCGLVIRQARNLRRHLLTSCPSRPVPEIEYQIELPETYVPTIDLLQNRPQEELLDRQSSLSSQLALNIGTTSSDSTREMPQNGANDFT